MGICSSKESYISGFGPDGRPLLRNPNTRVNISGGIIRFGIEKRVEPLVLDPHTQTIEPASTLPEFIKR